ncbi:MAG: NADH-quinone oxidoreductase subunit J, partial [Paracoccaceae bacterium]
MSVADLAFYCFAIVAVVAGLLVVVSRSPVHSVLWLILAFLSSAGLFVLLGAEFVAMLLIIVYVGAVAVLFLFVVMMLDVDFAELKAEMAKYMPLGGLIGVVLLMQLAIIFGSWQFAPGAEGLRAAVTPPAGEVHNTA